MAQSNSQYSSRKTAEEYGPIISDKERLSYFMKASFENPDLETSNILENISFQSIDNEFIKFSLQDIPQKIKTLEQLLQKSNNNVMDLKDSLAFVLDREKQTGTEFKTYKEQSQKLLDDKQQINKDLLMKLEHRQRDIEHLTNEIIELKDASKNSEQRLRQTNDKIGHLSRRVQELEAIIKESDEVMDQLRNELKGFEQQGSSLCTLQDRTYTLSEQLRKSEIRIEALEEENDEYRDKLESIKTIHESELSVLHHQNGKLEKELTTQKENHQSTIYYSLEQPLSLSYHVYLEALQDKIAEVNELKHALMEVAALATNNQIRDYLGKLHTDQSKQPYQNQYIANSVDTIQEWIAHQKASQREDKFTKALMAEKKLYNDLMERYKREMYDRRNLHNKLEDMKGTIRVYCRVRPLQPTESMPQNLILNEPFISHPESGIVKFYNHHTHRSNPYAFDKVFTASDEQQHVYDELSPLVTSVLDGFNVCVMAYGQTGSGKTYTMEGKHEMSGMVQMSLEQIFEMVEERSEDVDYSVSISILEVYNEQIRDLLHSNPDKSKLDIREINNNVVLHPKALSSDIRTYKEAQDIINKGRNNRKKAATNLNALSSRSHCIVTVNVVGKNKILNNCFAGKLHMIDLAGSERIYKSETEGERMKEACNINQSLTTLGKVLNGLAMKSPHIPYRESKLTHLLKESLGGTSKTLLIIQCSPNPRDMQESLSTLQFGTRVMKVEKGKAKQNCFEITPHNDSPSRIAGEPVAEINLKEISRNSVKPNRHEGAIQQAEKRVKDNKENIGPATKPLKSHQSQSRLSTKSERSDPCDSDSKSYSKQANEHVPQYPISSFGKVKDTINLSTRKSSVPSTTNGNTTPLGKVDMQATIESLQVLLDKTGRRKITK